MKLKLEKIHKVIITFLLLGVGYGMTLHAIAGELYDKGGYWEILAPQGEWFGMTIITIFTILLIVWFGELFKTEVKE